MTPSVLRVAEPSVWAEIERSFPLADHVLAELSPTERQVKPSFDRDGVPALARHGIEVSIRYARRAPTEAERAELAQKVAALSRRARAVLESAQRHAIDGWVSAWSAWDPENDRPAVRELLGASLIASSAVGPDRFVLNPELPPPPPIPYDFAEAAMDEPDDLSAPRPGPIALLHDLSSLAAAIEAVQPKRTLAGPISAADRKRLAHHLAARIDGPLEEDPRWGRALRGLEGLNVVSLDGADRTLGLDLGLEAALAGTTEEALDRLVHRLVDADLHSAVPAVRAALGAAGDGAVDEVVWLDLVYEQHRDVLIAPWHGPAYPALEGESVRAWDRDGFDEVETPQLGRLLGKLERLGLVRRAPGVFAGTADGRRWARTGSTPLPPVWVGSDLEVVVPPDGLTPWERFQIERLGRCLARDVVDRYRLERAGLVRWLRYHEAHEALDLLRRRSPGVPQVAIQTLESWTRSADRIVLVRG